MKYLYFKVLSISAFFSFILVIINSCNIINDTKTRDNITKNEENAILKFNLSEIEEPSEVTLSELGVVDIKYIPLETNHNCIVSGVRYNVLRKGATTDFVKIIAASDCFYINQFNNPGGRILRFASDGKFICTIGSVGNEPYQYAQLHDFSIDTVNNKACILSMLQDKIYIYTLKGEFIKSIICPENTTHINCVEGNILCYNRNTGTNENSFDLMNYEGNIIKSYYNKYKYVPGNLTIKIVNEECIFYWKEKQLHVKEEYSDTIFIYKNQLFEPKFILNRGEKRYTTDLMIYNNIQEMNEVSKKIPEVIREYSLLEAGNIIYSEFSHKRSFQMYTASVERTDSSIRTFKNGIVNDIDGGPNVYFKTLKDDTTIVCWINAEELKNYIASDAFATAPPKYPEKKAQLEKLSNNLKENDNPILMLLTLKE